LFIVDDNNINADANMAQNHYTGACNERKEPFVVVFTNTIIEPLTVVVKVAHTSVTLRTVLRRL